MIQVPVAKGIYNSKELLEEAMSEEKEGVTHLSKNKFEIKPIKAIYKHLMNGVSQIIPDINDLWNCKYIFELV